MLRTSRTTWGVGKAQLAFQTEPAVYLLWTFAYDRIPGRIRMADWWETDICTLRGEMISVKTTVHSRAAFRFFPKEGSQRPHLRECISIVTVLVRSRARMYWTSKTDHAS